MKWEICPWWDSNKTRRPNFYHFSIYLAVPEQQKDSAGTEIGLNLSSRNLHWITSFSAKKETFHLGKGKSGSNIFIYWWAHGPYQVTGSNTNLIKWGTKIGSYKMPILILSFTCLLGIYGKMKTKEARSSLFTPRLVPILHFAILSFKFGSLRAVSVF